MLYADRLALNLYTERFKSVGEALVAAAARQKDGEDTAFVSNELVFGSLGQDPRFVEAFTGALKAIREKGARAVLRELVS